MKSINNRKIFVLVVSVVVTLGLFLGCNDVGNDSSDVVTEYTLTELFEIVPKSLTITANAHETTTRNISSREFSSPISESYSDATDKSSYTNMFNAISTEVVPAVKNYLVGNNVEENVVTSLNETIDTSDGVRLEVYKLTYQKETANLEVHVKGDIDMDPSESNGPEGTYHMSIYSDKGHNKAYVIMNYSGNDFYRTDILSYYPNRNSYVWFRNHDDGQDSQIDTRKYIEYEINGSSTIFKEYGIDFEVDTSTANDKTMELFYSDTTSKLYKYLYEGDYATDEIDYVWTSEEDSQGEEVTDLATTPEEYRNARNDWKQNNESFMSDYWNNEVANMATSYAADEYNSF